MRKGREERTGGKDARTWSKRDARTGGARHAHEHGPGTRSSVWMKIGVDAEMVTDHREERLASTIACCTDD